MFRCREVGNVFIVITFQGHLASSLCNEDISSRIQIEHRLPFKVHNSGVSGATELRT